MRKHKGFLKMELAEFIRLMNFFHVMLVSYCNFFTTMGKKKQKTVLFKTANYLHEGYGPEGSSIGDFLREPNPYLHKEI